MGFYAPDSLIHEAQRRGIEILPADVNHSDHECTATREGAIRLGLSYIKGLRDDDARRLLAARGRGGYRSLEQLAATAGVSAATLERLAWSGACDLLAGGGPHARRVALWQLGVATPAYTTPAGGQLALELPLDQAPGLPALTPWEQMLADYQATGVCIGQHPVELLRPMLDQQGATQINQLPGVAHGTNVVVGGLVIARQRPQTANGIIFLLLEDAGGNLNVIVPEKLYVPHRLTIRTEPLVLVHGHVERHIAGGGAVNLLATRLQPLHPADPTATVRQLHPKQPKPNTAVAGSDGEDFKAAAPTVTSFGRGRR
ncbi:MAG: OB-fold nucleic acid binding domain-containing protein [Solirubrobacteraceae bacterium]